jgi:tetratricopeptide (TPR) repeat protein
MCRLLLIAVLSAIVLSVSQPAFADRDDDDCFKATTDETGDRAIAVCSRILARGKVKDRDLARTLNNRGLGYMMNKDVDKAMADFDSAVRADATYPFAFDNRGDVWRTRGQFDRAIAEYNEALRRDPNFVSAYVNRGMTFAKMGNRVSAKADFDAVLAMPNLNRPIDQWARETAQEQLKLLGKVE